MGQTLERALIGALEEAHERFAGHGISEGQRVIGRDCIPVVAVAEGEILVVCVVAVSVSSVAAVSAGRNRIAIVGAPVAELA